MGLPPSVGFFSEVLIIVGGLSYSFFCVFLFFLIVFFVCLYRVYFYCSVMHGVSFFSLHVFMRFVDFCVFLVSFFFVLFFAFFLDFLFF
jgi:hypothetical protein